MVDSGIRPKDFAQAEADLLWWFSYMPGELGLSSQTYDFDVPHAGTFDSNDAIAHLMGDREIVRGRREHRRLLPIIGEFAGTSPEAFAVARRVYTPHGWPGEMFRRMSLGGGRSGVSLVPLLASSVAAKAELERANTALCAADYFEAEFLVMNAPSRRQRAEKVLQRVVSELAPLLDAAVVAFAQIRAPHVAQARDAREQWYRSLAGAA